MQTDERKNEAFQVLQNSSAKIAALKGNHWLTQALTQRTTPLPWITSSKFQAKDLQVLKGIP